MLEEGFEKPKDGEGHKITRKVQPRILVSTTSTIGTCLNLARACKLVIMEPGYLNRVENQAKARIQRVSLVFIGSSFLINSCQPYLPSNLNPSLPLTFQAFEALFSAVNDHAAEEGYAVATKHSER